MKIRELISKLRWRFCPVDKIAQPIAENILQGFHGIAHTEEERRKMTPAQLAILLSKCDKDSPAYILFEHELKLRIVKAQSRPAYWAILMTIVGLLLGWVLSQYKPFQSKTSLDIIAEHIKKQDEISSQNKPDQTTSDNGAVPRNITVEPSSNKHQEKSQHHESDKENAYP